MDHHVVSQYEEGEWSLLGDDKGCTSQQLEWQKLEAWYLNIGLLKYYYLPIIEWLYRPSLSPVNFSSTPSKKCNCKSN